MIIDTAICFVRCSCGEAHLLTPGQRKPEYVCGAKEWPVYLKEGDEVITFNIGVDIEKHEEASQ